MLPNGDQLESALARLEQAKQESTDLRHRIADATYKASPKNKLFTVTVSGRGELTSLVFRGDDYRMLPPAEFAKLLVTTIERARRQSVSSAMKGIGGLTSGTAVPVDQLSQATSVDDFMSILIEATEQALPKDLE